MTEPLEPPFDLPEPPRPWSSPQIEAICGALAAVQAEIEGIPLDSANPFFKSRYASLGAVISQSKAALAKHGLAIVQVANLRGDTISLETKLLHKSGQWIDGGILSATLAEEKGRSMVQSAGSFLTFTRRYSRMAVLQLYGDEDTDGNDVQTKPSPPKPATSTPPKPVDPDAVAKWDTIRLKLLNRLNAAPGQPARQFITDYLDSKGWITRDQLAEDWPTKHIPTTEEGAKALFEDIQMFERRRNEQALTEEQV